MTEQLTSEAITAYLMQYVGLGVIFWFGIYVAMRAGDLSLRTRHGRRWFTVLVGGYVFYAVMHGFFQVVLPFI